MAVGLLKVQGDEIVNAKGDPVVLRGAAIGGWMNMENFITGYPGHESQHRSSMLKVLGQEKYDFFFDKWLEYFFTDADAKYFASLGLNCLRIPFNYRHFEDDMNPRVLKLGGFKHLDRVIQLCCENELYVILDLHTVPGGQNCDWHSDNITSHASFWDYKDHQDRTIWLWEQIAARYKCNPWVVGYNPLNEPCDPEHVRLPAFYDRVATAIRSIDSDHILFLDGNTFAMEWKGFNTVIPNSVYSLHDYSMMGFPNGPNFEGSQEQITKLETQFIRKAEFMARMGTPIWNGEFGPVYAGANEINAEKINNSRYNLLEQQLSIYDRYHIHWSIWLFKDIGTMGIVTTKQKSKWNELITPFIKKKKKAYQLDGWGRDPTEESDRVLKPLVEWIDKVSPTAKNTYPTPWSTETHVLRNIHQTFLAASFSDEFANLFKDLEKDDLDALAYSFHFDECEQRTRLNQVLQGFSKPRGDRQQVPVYQKQHDHPIGL